VPSKTTVVEAVVHPRVKASAFATVTEASYATKVVSEMLPEDLTDILEKAPLDSVMSEVDVHRHGMVVCHHHQLEEKGNRRERSMVRVRHFYLRIELLTATMI
jgi:hypothetical protein